MCINDVKIGMLVESAIFYPGRVGEVTAVDRTLSIVTVLWPVITETGERFEHQEHSCLLLPSKKGFMEKL